MSSLKQHQTILYDDLHLLQSKASLMRDGCYNYFGYKDTNCNLVKNYVDVQLTVAVSSLM